jgi:N-terminal half of MaoC dehydratase
MPETYISEAMQAAVGRELDRRVSFPIAASDIRKWAVAVYYPEEPPRLFWDETFAAGTRHGGIVAPEDFNPFAWMSAEPRGVPKRRGGADAEITEQRLGVPGPGLRFQLNGGIAAEYGVRMRPGDVITSVNRLAGYHERDGRLGRMLFTAMASTWTNQRDEIVKRVETTLIRY